MAINLCFYFQVHQPWRLRDYQRAEVGCNHDYFDEPLNSRIMRQAADNCYLPMNALLVELIREFYPDFRVSFSITATALEQMQAYAPDALASFRRLMSTGCVELLAETSHHSLAALYSPAEFAAQVTRHRQVCTRLLHMPGRVFRNTGLIISNAIAAQVAALGYTGVCVEGADRLFGVGGMLSPRRFAAAPDLCALPRHIPLSEDIAARFSDHAWDEWPLSAKRYAGWVEGLLGSAVLSGREGFLGIFMDYETFGVRQPESTGIFDFMRALPGAVLARNGLRFVTASEARDRVESAATRVDFPEPVSWAGFGHDNSVWIGSPIQTAIEATYALESRIGEAANGDPGLLEDWRRLLASDHAHDPGAGNRNAVYDYSGRDGSLCGARSRYRNVLADLSWRCGNHKSFEQVAAAVALRTLRADVPRPSV